MTFESRKNSFPAFYLLIGSGLAALIFQDRLHYLLGVMLATVLFLGCYGIGKRLAFSVLKTADHTIYFPLGLGITLAASWSVGMFHLTNVVILSIWGIVALFALFEIPILAHRLTRSSLWSAPLVLLAVWSAFTPILFPDTLSQQNGIAEQYLASGRITAYPNSIYTAFAPFGQVLSLLFLVVQSDSGLKLFSIIVYFHIASLIVSLLRWLITEPVFASTEGSGYQFQTDLVYLTKTELILVPILLLPCAYALIHFADATLLASLFFCAGCCYLIKEFDLISSRKIAVASLLLGLSILTRQGMVLFVLLMPVLWFALGGRRSGAWKEIGLIWAICGVLWVPLLIRNYVFFGDPFYPALSGIVSSENWSPSQSAAFTLDTMSQRKGLTDVLSAMLALLIQPSQLGPAAQVGILPFLSLGLYGFTRKLKAVNRILLFVLASFAAWVFVFRDFRHFLPVFLLIFPAAYFAFRYLFVRSLKYLRIAWGVCLAVALSLLLPVYKTFPLILPHQSQPSFLEQHLNYYRIAQAVNRQPDSSKVLLLGEERIAHFRKPILFSSKYDQTPVLVDMRNLSDGVAIFSQLRREGIRYIVFNESGFEQKHHPGGSVPLTPAQYQSIRKVLSENATEALRSGTVVLYELKEPRSWS